MSTLISSLLGGVTSALSGIWGYVAAAGLSAAVAAAGTGYVVHKMDAADLANLKLQYAQANIKAVNVALSIQSRQDRIAESTAIAESAAQQKIVVQTITLKEKVPYYVTRSIPCISFGLVRVLDAAAAGVDPGNLPLATGQSNDACAALTAVDLARSVAANYGAARQNAEQLTALQAWAAANHVASK